MRFHHLFHKKSAAWLLAIAALIGPGTATAQQWPTSPRLSHDRAVMLQTADLERAFWMCDYTATVRGVYATPVETCAAITDELEQHKFNGSFEELLAWWQFNKPAEHDKLANRPTANALARSGATN
ncbi:MAG: hypothetical protein V4637_16320 [Pseudomonadota bacterium]